MTRERALLDTLKSSDSIVYSLYIYPYEFTGIYKRRLERSKRLQREFYTMCLGLS